MFSRVLTWAFAHPVEATAIATAAIGLLRSLYALLTRLVAPYPRLRAVVEAVAALGPDVLRFLLQIARAITGRPIPSVTLDARDARIAELERQVVALGGTPSPAAPTSLPGRVSVGVLLVLLSLALGGLVACPNWNRPQCSSPGAYSCVRNQPHYCATATHELTPMGDEPCERTGRVCGVDPDGVTTCVAPGTAADGGVQ